MESAETVWKASKARSVAFASQRDAAVAELDFEERAYGAVMAGGAAWSAAT